MPQPSSRTPAMPSPGPGLLGRLTVWAAPGQARTAALAALGLALWQASGQVVYESWATTLEFANPWSLGIAHLAGSAAVVCAALALVGTAARLAPLSQRRGLLYSLAGLGCLATLGMIAVHVGLLGVRFDILLLALTSFVSAVLMLACVEVIIALGARRALIAFAAATISGNAAGLLIALLPVNASLAVAALVPVLCVAALRPHGRANAVACEDKRLSTRALVRASPWRLVAAFGASTFAFGAIRASFHAADAASISPVLKWMTELVVGTIAFAAGVLVSLAAHRANAFVVFYIGLPLVGLASFILLVSNDALMLYALPAASAGVDVMRLLVWLWLADIVARQRVPVVFCFALLGVGQFTGTFLGHSFAILTRGDKTAIAFAILAILLLAALFVISARGSLEPTEAGMGESE
ncbi:MAG: hypothetical protein LBG11_06660, partial [Bifidobacteriaceae bacterium]|nr:hypothetical protein [Bifidobacteriaceae bacterium]